jgi:hypothetical protein
MKFLMTYKGNEARVEFERAARMTQNARQRERLLWRAARCGAAYGPR